MHLSKERRPSSLALLALLYASLEGYLWFTVPSRQKIPISIGALAFLAVMIVDPWWRGESLDSAGVTFRNFAASVQLLAAPTLLALGVILGLHILMPDAPRGGRFLKRLVQILPWALLQQGLLQAIFNKRLSDAFGPGLKSSLVNGLLFGGMHLPGPALSLATFLAGTWWSRVYQKAPNLWALVISHALLSAAAQSFLPSAWTHGFRVGSGYFRWR